MFDFPGSKVDQDWRMYVPATKGSTLVALTACSFWSYPLVVTNIPMGNGPFIDGLPIKNGGPFHGELLKNQMVYTELRGPKHTGSQILTSSASLAILDIDMTRA